MTEVIWSPAAADHLDSICNYLEIFNPQAAE
jgi:plasmid stabilization system protein ParE